MSPVVSIIICTRNRAESLRATLESIARCQVPADLPVEIVVVDNGSTDHTRQVVEQVNARYVHEPSPGQAHARNRGLNEARGQIVLFTDDDVRVPANWIEGMCRPIVSRKADAVAGGITMAAHLERPWMNDFLRMWTASSDCSAAAGGEPIAMIGANMAFSRNVLAKVPAFDPELGPGALGFEDDTLFSRQLKRAGFRLAGTWNIAVEHHFDESRLGESSFIEIARRLGRSQAYVAHHWWHRTIRWPRLRTATQLLKLCCRNLISTGSKSPRIWKLCYERDLSFVRQFVRERGRARNYARFGLERLDRAHQSADVRVSAVVPTFNRSAAVTRAIDSILAQSVSVDEIIVVDDGSTDGTAEMLRRRYGEQIRVVEQPNGGVSAARKRCVAEARGRWIAFLDSDDQWHVDHMRDLLRVTEQVPQDIAWIFGDTMTVTDAGETQTLYSEFGLTLNSDPQVFQDSLTVQFPFQFGLFQSSLIRRSALLEVGCFNEGLRSDDDLLVGFQVACRYRYAATKAVVTKLDRTAHLRQDSVELLGRFSVGYFQARVKAFALAVETGRPGPWRQLHRDAVRGLCLKLAEQGNSNVRKLALRQFRYGFSFKSAAFLLAAMLGKPGLDLWNGLKRMQKQPARSELTSAPQMFESAS